MLSEKADARSVLTGGNHGRRAPVIPLINWSFPSCRSFPLMRDQAHSGLASRAKASPEHSPIRLMVSSVHARTRKIEIAKPRRLGHPGWFGFSDLIGAWGQPVLFVAADLSGIRLPVSRQRAMVRPTVAFPTLNMAATAPCECPSSTACFTRSRKSSEYGFAIGIRLLPSRHGAAPHYMGKDSMHSTLSGNALKPSDPIAPHVPVA